MGEKRNLTITVDEETAEWVRVAAAKEGSSMSRFVGALLEREREAREGYEAAARSLLSREPQEIRGGEDEYPSRGAVHDR